MPQQEDDTIQRVVIVLVETAEVMRQAAQALRGVAADLVAQVGRIKELGS